MINRKVKIWIKNFEDCKILYKNESFEKIYKFKKSETHNFIIAPIKSSIIKIKSISGNFSIGNIELNYSPKINKFYQDNFKDELDNFLNNGADLSLCSEKFFNHLIKKDIFISSGKNNYSATTNLKNKIFVNDIEKEVNYNWYPISENSEFCCDVYLSLPFIKKEKISLIKKSQPTLIKNYNQEFINKLDKKYFNFVEKFLQNSHIEWKTIRDDYILPYSYKVRIEALIHKNLEMIKDKNVIDYGCHMGHFTYPCIIAGCKSILGAQILTNYNEAINAAFKNMNLYHIGHAIYCDLYDLVGVKKSLENIDTILFSGVIYHINHHYSLLQEFTKSTAKNIIIDCSLQAIDLKFYLDKQPQMFWIYESQSNPENGQEKNSIDKNKTFVGIPNYNWIINALESLGWTIKNNDLVARVRTDYPNFGYRGVISAYR